MINSDSKVAVCSRSFSSNETLRAELLAKFPDSRFNDRGITLTGDALASFIGNSDAAIIGLEKVDETLLSRTPKLKVVGKYGVGVNNIDFHSMEKHSIKFGWTKGVNKRSVAELTLGFTISLLRSICTHNGNLSKGVWSPVVGKELSSITFGVLGCGHVGKEMVNMLKPFGTKIIACDILDQHSYYHSVGIESATKTELLKLADVVSLHVPLTPTMKNFIDKDELSLMKESAYLINTARGGLVNENTLYEALKTGKIAGAAFDVFADEPAVDNKLLSLDNFYSTPHIGGSTSTSILAMGRSAITGLSEFKDAKHFFDMY